MISITNLNFVTYEGLSSPNFLIFMLYQFISSNFRCILSVIPKSWLSAQLLSVLETHHVVKSLKLMCEAHISWNTNVWRQGICPFLLPHQPHQTNRLTKFSTIHPYDKGKHQYNLSPRYCNTSWHFLQHQEIYLNLRSKVGCCDFQSYGFLSWKLQCAF